MNRNGPQLKSIEKKIKSESQICISSSAFMDTWPVDQATQLWNRNHRTILVEDSDSCEGHVMLHELDMTVEQVQGETVFYEKPFIGITVNSSVPNEFRLSVLCHEFGHVLGLPHVTGPSCMDPEQDISQPSQGELTLLRDSTWDWTIASRQAHGK